MAINVLLRRRTALLGGTTTAGDCWVALRYLLRPSGLVRGEAIVEYERAFSALVGVRWGLSFSSGRVGLYGVLRALGIGAGDEVLLQAPTHIVVANAIRYTGARPVYVDCLLSNYNIDLDQVRQRITGRTRAIILQHTFGIPVDMGAAQALAAEHGLPLIEDCVHALGTRYRGKPVGSFGRAAFFSTEETKTITSTMGGMVTTDDPEIAGRLAAFQRSCAAPAPGLVRRYLLKLVMYHALMEPHVHRFSRSVYEGLGKRHPLPRPTDRDELQGRKPARYERSFSNAQAAVALGQLRRLDANLRHRQRLASLYRDLLSARGFRVPEEPPASEPAYVRYPVWVEDRKEAVRRLAPHLVAGTWFSSVLEEAESQACGDYEPGSCPRAELAARHLINLPTHPRVGERDAEMFVRVLGGPGRGS
jgi:dTDP-4-amino-4,6-dideoxygalactose transaminase